MSDRRCQLHEERPCVVRISSVSAANTPLVHDLCGECARMQIDGFRLFGLHPEAEFEWFEDAPELRARVPDPWGETDE